MSLEIVMYHYVRPIRNSEYPNIRGLELNSFIRQIEYFKKKKNIISTSQVIDFFSKKSDIPENSVWLTFDDGYKDHIKYVVPVLENFNCDATFFPVSDTFTKNRILDVNAIQFIIEKSQCEDGLVKKLKRELLEIGYTKKEYEKLREETNKKKRFDSEKISFFKIVLQKKLNKEDSNLIINRLFEETVKKKKEEFSNELYMSQTDLKLLLKKGFSIGSHTASHRWLNELEYFEQEAEIKKSLSELQKLGIYKKNWIMCYPYGAYNNDTLKILQDNDCFLALTTKVGNVNSNLQSKLELPRFDTNDFPQ